MGSVSMVPSGLGSVSMVPDGLGSGSMVNDVCCFSLSITLFITSFLSVLQRYCKLLPADTISLN